MTEFKRIMRKAMRELKLTQINDKKRLLVYLLHIYRPNPTNLKGLFSMGASFLGLGGRSHLTLIDTLLHPDTLKSKTAESLIAEIGQKLNSISTSEGDETSLNKNGTLAACLQVFFTFYPDLIRCLGEENIAIKELFAINKLLAMMTNRSHANLLHISQQKDLDKNGNREILNAINSAASILLDNQDKFADRDINCVANVANKIKKLAAISDLNLLNDDTQSEIPFYQSPKTKAFKLFKTLALRSQSSTNESARLRENDKIDTTSIFNNFKDGNTTELSYLQQAIESGSLEADTVRTMAIQAFVVNDEKMETQEDADPIKSAKASAAYYKLALPSNNALKLQQNDCNDDFARAAARQ